jgi:hypothetical protein
MDTRIGSSQPDVVTVSSEPRPTPTKTQFSDVLASGATSVVQGAEAAMTVLPGSPMTALAVRGPLPGPPMPGLPTPGLGLGMSPGFPAGMPGLPMTPGMPGMMPTGAPAMPGVAGAGGLAAEGPGAVSPSAGAALGSALASGIPGALMGDGGLQATMMQSQQMNMYYLQVQQQVDAENRTFSTLSNVLKAENDTVKNAIGNIH